jgi:hypothetical protein
MKRKQGDLLRSRAFRRQFLESNLPDLEDLPSTFFVLASDFQFCPAARADKWCDQLPEDVFGRQNPEP